MERNEYICELEIPKITNYDDYDYNPNEVFFPITNIRWYTDSQILFSSGSGDLKLYNITDPDPKRRLREELNFKDSAINAVDIDLDKNNFITGGSDHYLRVYDCSTMKEIICYKGGDTKHSEHFNRIFSVIFDSSNPHIFYSGGWDKQIMTHDVRQPHAVRSFMGPYIAGDSIDICGNELLAGSYRSNDPIEVYDVGTGDMIDYIQWDQEDPKKGGMIMTAQYGFPNTETIIAGSSSSHEVKMWNRKDTSVLSTVTGFSGPVVAMHLNDNGDTLAIGSKLGGVVLLSHGKEKSL
mmetsp:Transcript_16664/g.14577  ORF Transcript_16664/g.14577 Transcript_16664/m.14577 type:complete len:294 (+) Transcript_16664:54-935(+)